MTHRVVVTGMGVVAPNGHGLDEFAEALRRGKSGVRLDPELERLKFRCHVSARPPALAELRDAYFEDRHARAAGDNTTSAAIAALDCWRDAGFPAPNESDAIDWDTGVIIGSSTGSPDVFGDRVAPEVRDGHVRRVGSLGVSEVVSSSVSMRVGGMLGLGGRSNATCSACASGTQAIVDAFDTIKLGRARRVIAGGSDAPSPYIWATLDALRLLASRFNDAPERASRPLSASSSGIVPAGGAGLLMLESLESARERGARIYAEVLGGAVNAGGQRHGGSMSAPNPEGIERCVRQALAFAGVDGGAVDLLNGHLTGTLGDVVELGALARALGRAPEAFPWVNATKSLIGHAMSAAGGIESVATVLELVHGFLHPTVNCEDLRPELEGFRGRIPVEARAAAPQLALKTSFGFGDVNACVLFKRWEA